jgi:hypothetical protein
MKTHYYFNTIFVFFVSFVLFACGRDDQKSNITPKEINQTADKPLQAITSPDLKGQLIDNQKTMPGTPVPLPVKEEKPSVKNVQATQSKIELPADLEKKSMCQGTDETKWNNCVGTLSLPNGYKYAGDWVDGKQNGKGVTTLANGYKYSGEFKNNKFHGQGNAILPNGVSYIGEFKDGNYYGKGTLTFLDGTKHVGEFVAGIPNGHGSLLFSNGDKYEGGFKDGKYNGKGTFTFAKSKESQKGLWADGKFVLAD